MWSAFLALLGGSDGPLSKLIGLIPDPNARAKAQAEFEKQFMEIAAQQSTAQTNIDQQEAASASVFVAGWRPFIGWVCGFAMAWQYVLQPFLTWGFALYGAKTHDILPPLPTLDTSQMYTVLMGMLGLGGLRTYEKLKDVARDSLKS